MPSRGIFFTAIRESPAESRATRCLYCQKDYLSLPSISFHSSGTGMGTCGNFPSFKVSNVFFLKPLLPILLPRIPLFPCVQ